jgi:RND family efflux transporter MFP subunit
MNTLLKFTILSLLAFIATQSSVVSANQDQRQEQRQEQNIDEHGHVEEHNDEHKEESPSITLSKEQQTLVNIKVEALQMRNLDYTIYAPGEIQANGYTSYLVSPRVDSVVMKRHKALGDHVQKGEKLVTLFSESVAQAQATLKVNMAEWKRVNQLGRKAVGASRHIKAQNDYELAKARLLAFGLSKKALTDSSIPLGEYTLIAHISGAILSDEFQQGQRVEAGHALMLLSDESQLWVVARIQASVQLDLPIGTLAQVKVGEHYYPAKVSQEAHTIDEKTRTRVVRLLIDNPNDTLHPGEFADVFFKMQTKQAVLSVPEDALMRSTDGDWVVFVESHNNQFAAVEVDLGRILGGNREIFGLDAGIKVVTQGAFFVASEIAKGGFDPHGH